jgi:hypothetical protein
MHSRIFARYLRALVACVMLALASAPASAVVAAWGDAMACVAGAHGEARAEGRTEDAPCTRRGGTESMALGPLSRDGCRVRRRAARLPAGALSVVARRRIYLRHAALLR